MKNSKTAIVLGGTNPHIALINNLKNRGYYTILIDYYENPPAKQYADEHIRESALEKDKVLSIAKETNAELVVSCCVDRFIPICSYVSEQLNLKFPISYENSLKLTNKLLMKNLMMENKISTGIYIEVNENFSNEDIKFNFPLVVKPSDSEGSIGIGYIESADEVLEKIQDALAASKNKKAIIEEFYKGEEIQVDFYIQNNIPQILLARQKLKKITTNGTFITLGSLIPVELNQKLNNELNEIAKQIAFALKINNTPLLIQAIINEDQIKVIEFTARVGGQLSYKIIKDQTGIDIIDLFVSGVLNEQKHIDIKNSEDKLLTYIIHANKGVYNSFKGYERFISDKTIKDFVEYRTKGMQIPEGLSAKNRIGAITFSGKNIDELKYKYQLVMNSITSIDLSDNKDIINKNLLIDFNEITTL